MAESIRRNAALLIGLLIVGFVCGQAAGYMASPRGANGPTILQAESPAVALLAVVAVLLVATVVAIVVARLINTAVGLFVLGAGVFVLAHRVSTVEEIIQGGGSLAALIAELLLWSVMLLGMVVIVFRFGGKLPDVHPREDGRTPHPIGSRAALIGAAAGILVLPVVWLVAQSPMKGQVLAAVFFGGMAVGWAGRLLAPNVQPVLLFVAPCVFGAIGYAVGIAMLDAPLREAFAAGTVPAFLLPMPVDYAAGSLMGVAVGLGCAKSFLQEEDEEQQVQTSAT
jgi:hypothetical protein